MAVAAPPPAGSISQLIAERPMSRPQMSAVALCVALNALDGFDVLAITFAAPGITRDWGIGPAQLGAALSSGLVGMAVGSLALAPLGDRFGRRPLILCCLFLMTLGLALTATAGGIVSLCVWRVVTGLGIGGMLAAINAVAAEFSNRRRRDLSIALMTIGYPIGGLIGGFSVAGLVAPYGWQAVFVFGAIVTGAFLPLTWLILPESLDFLARRNDPAARARIDATLARMGHPAVTPEPRPREEAVRGGSFADLFGPRYRRTTILLVIAYFCHITTFYFFSGWLPKLMTDLGHAAPDAIRTSALMSLGGVIGGLLLGWAAPRYGLIRLLVGVMVGTSVSFVGFGLATGLFELKAVAFVAGMCVFSGVVGLYSLLARAYPPELRVTGTGFAIGIGRGGAVLGPLVGGFLIANGASITASIALVGIGASIAAAALAIWSRGRAREY